MKWRESTQLEKSTLLEGLYDSILTGKWNDFCLNYPDQSSETYEQVEIDDQRSINIINYEVNREKYHKDDVDKWICSATGDCEDKALEKRRRLNRELGIPLGAMSLAICKNRNNITHAVLCLHTTAGDYILDNENAMILPWEITGLRFTFIISDNQWYNI